MLLWDGAPSCMSCMRVLVCSGISCSIRSIAVEECRVKATINFRCHFVLENMRSCQRTSFYDRPHLENSSWFSRWNDSTWIITCTRIPNVSKVHDALTRFEVAVTVVWRMSETFLRLVCVQQAPWGGGVRRNKRTDMSLHGAC